MSVSTFAHPCYQAFALPRVKDQQRSQPTPSDYIFHLALYTLLYIATKRIIKITHVDVSLHYLCDTFQSCEV